jgi:hypothetical protein
MAKRGNLKSGEWFFSCVLKSQRLLFMVRGADSCYADAAPACGRYARQKTCICGNSIACGLVLSFFG